MRVFIIGSGASAELDFKTNQLSYQSGGKVSVAPTNHELSGPMSSGFFYYSQQFYSAISRVFRLASPPQIGRHLHPYLSDEYKINDAELQNDQVKSKKINVEEVYRCLENKTEQLPDRQMNLARLGNDPQYNLTMALEELRKYIHKVLAIISWYCESHVHERFIRILKPGDVLISFNWDILLEEALIKTGKWNYSTGYGFSFSNLRNKGDSFVRVFKPHGSINWYRSTNGMFECKEQPAPQLRGGYPVILDAFKCALVPRA